MSDPFRYFNSSPEVIRLIVMLYVKYPLSLRNVEDLLAERGINIRHETVRFWWNRFGPMFAAEIRRKRVNAMRGMADFGHFAIRSDDLDAVLNEAYRLVGEALATHRSKILELQPGGLEILVRAGVEVAGRRDRQRSLADERTVLRNLLH